jgi:hypothetical protein
VPYIGVPRAVVERRMQRGQHIGGPQARVPLYVPYADFFQYQAGAGRLAGYVENTGSQGSANGFGQRRP